MASPFMKCASKMQQIFLMDGVTEDFMDRGHVCFNCEQIFANRKCLEDHVCPRTSFICSCGTEFTLYNDMLEHNATHEPGHQVLDHRIIKKRRIEKYKEEEAKLKRLQKGEVVWNAPSVSGRNTSAHTSQLSMRTLQVKQVPETNPKLSEASALSNPLPSATDTQKTVSSVGAPTVDLWTLYQPVVLLKSIRKFPKPYTCGKCGQGFVSKISLTIHSNSHVTDKVCGCIGCGLLLSSRKFVPRFHTCTSPTSNSKFRLITAKPPHFKSPNVRKTLFAQQRLATSAEQLKNQSLTTAGKGIQVSRVTSQQKTINMKTYKSNNTKGAPVRTLLQAKHQNPTSFKAVVGASVSSNSNQNSQKQSVSSSTVLTNLANPAPPDADGEFKCRVCHLPFKTPLILQRHKCIKAQEFMAKHLMGGKSQQRFTKPAASPGSVQVNGNKKPEFSPSVGAKKNQIAAVNLDKGKADVPVNGNVVVDDDDDDCYIVEGGSEKPAEVIYQVTSSVPIKS
uniref:C2H2-type domain-containing protein n=1 Tax=Iconisemion striatum TaxID=60296 RepID=A0A1A7WRC0_9TELE